MEEKLALLLQDCESYLRLYREQKENPDFVQKHEARYLAIQQLHIALPKAIDKLASKDKKENPVIEFNELYNKNFDYLHKFTGAPQNSIKHLLHYQQLVQKMAKLYTGIPKETLERQGKILQGRKKDIEKWSRAISNMLQSTENRQALEERFLELLDIANAALAKQGIAAISIDSNNDDVQTS